jgi:hypothetical protein
MRYPAFRAHGLFAASGVIEAVRDANAMLALRCCRLSRRFEDYRADR